jgi:hypothetical protein
MIHGETSIAAAESGTEPVVCCRSQRSSPLMKQLRCAL